jgi:mRNA interferase MazF
VKKTYAPARGDLVWLDMHPQAGHEQAGRRPAIVLSPEAYNRKVGLALCCPITSHAKDYPFEVALPTGLPVSGVILSDQIKNLDWKSRKAKHIGRVDEQTILEVLQKIRVLLSTEQE